MNLNKLKFHATIVLQKCVTYPFIPFAIAVVKWNEFKAKRMNE